MAIEEKSSCELISEARHRAASSCKAGSHGRGRLELKAFLYLFLGRPSDLTNPHAWRGRHTASELVLRSLLVTKQHSPLLPQSAQEMSSSGLLSRFCSLVPKQKLQMGMGSATGWQRDRRGEEEEEEEEEGREERTSRPSVNVTAPSYE
ncbi:hypothetical protein EYF80_013404 [Liparis tanakae]|uniref:Uncharacterized protein n=1 Tax=Liparis tanakae TaxID=230148 RepID=A0A4Z2IFG1_9TELE|nr:hypothetical protein EYF80_013404 [Liparis tanakae]